MLGKNETMATATSFRFILKWWIEGLKEMETSLEEL
jgi:hypothetical protein